MKDMTINTSSNNTSYSPRKGLPSKVEGIAFCSAFGLVAVFVVVGNLLTILLFAVHNKLRKKSLFLIINMAFADLIVGAVSQPGYIYLYLGNYYRLWTAEVHMLVHIFYGAINLIFSTTSIVSATLICVERYHAIHRPLKHRTLTMRAYSIVIIIAWTLAILISTLFIVSVLFISRAHAYFALTSFYLTLLFIACGCNIGIWRNVKRGSIAPQQQNRTEQNNLLTKTLLFVSISSLLSWTPLIVVQYLRYSGFYDSPITFYMAVIFNKSNFFVNPIVYALRIPEFRQALGLCCFRSLAVIKKIRQDNEGSDNRAAALTPVTQLRTLPTDPSHLQLAFKQEIMDTKL